LNRKIRLASVFSGIGAVEFAMKRLNLDYDIVFACDNGNIEIDCNPETELKKIKTMSFVDEKQAYVREMYEKGTNRTNFVKQSYLANYDIDEKRFFEDIRLIDGDDFADRIDLFVGGSPCQSFSSVGFQHGLDDARGTLFYDFARLIREMRPKVFIYENVRGLYTHDNKNTWNVIRNIFDSLGYHYHYDILNSKDYGIPQNRRRVFVVGFKDRVDFEFPTKEELKFTMQDFLIENNEEGSVVSREGSIVLENRPGKVDDKYFLTPKLYDYVMNGGTKTFYSAPKIDLPVARPILSTMGNRHRAGIDNYVTVNGKVRMLTPREAHRLMGFTDDYEIAVSRAQAYKQAGNSIVVDLLMRIITQILNTNAIGEVKFHGDAD